MRLIDSKVEIIPQEWDLDGIARMIETAGRTCYKSEDKITDGSATRFVDKMIANGHTAMLEHGTVYLCIPVEDWDKDAHEWEYMFPEGSPWVSRNCDGRFHLITTNLRHIINKVGIETVTKYLCQPVNGHEKRVTVRFTCDRGVSHELVRHRVFSFAQESTRYCNYSKDKFGNELTYIIPSWMDLNPGEYTFERDDSGHKVIIGDGYYYDMSDGIAIEPAFLYNLMQAEFNYFSMLTLGWTPQQARQLLPNALKTEVVMTGFVKDWEHFFELRCAKNAHPDMQLLANQLKEKFKISQII